ncbi:hypothetical protein [Nocardia crassostreae]|uniref:hypothetical protein n=1 Tax=Nocardia crassostreae TaxID=53428 RepID=UPI00082F3196|nr:hypothetical protein [Nocardia crassostreae]
MATGVGLRIADDECVVAVVIGDDATLPVHYIARESVLHMSDDGDAALGGPRPDGHTHSISGFVKAVGDPAGIPVDDGEAYRAEDLMATAAFCLIQLAADHLNGPAEFYATHPTGWTEAHVQALREALDYLGLKSVVLVSERDLPQPEGETGKSLAYNAARAALAAVLSTPAGLTPPDPTAGAENAAEVTEVLPALKFPEPVAHAYSAALPVSTTAEPVVQTDTAESEIVKPRSGRGAYMIAAAAAVIGLLLGGLGVATVLRGDEEKPGPPRGEVVSDPATAGAVPPLLPPPTSSEEPAPVPPIAEQLEVEPTTEPPATTSETTTVTTPPSTTPPPSSTTTTRPVPPIYRYPPVPTFDLPMPPGWEDPWAQNPQ